MIRSLLISLSILMLTYALRVYIDSFEKPQGQEETVNLLEDITIRSYSRTGIEWTIKGKTLEVVSEDVKLNNAEFFSKEAHIRSSQAYIDRSTGKGKLIGGVELESEDLRAKTPSAYINLKEGKVWGEGEVEIIQDKNLIRGKGFEINLKPLKVIINRAKVNMQ